MNDKLQQIDTLLGELNQYRANENYRITEALEIEYTYDSNRIEGNTLTLHETDMVVNKGITLDAVTVIGILKVKGASGGYQSQRSY